MSADYQASPASAGLAPGAGLSCSSEPGFDPARWVEDHGDALYRFAVVRLGNPTDAEEVVQECLLSALRGEESFAARSSERTWLVGILKHKIVDFIRRAANHRTAHDQPSDHKSSFFNAKGLWRIVPDRWHDDPSIAIQSKEFGAVLLGCLGKLPAGMADVVVLRELNHLTSREVCETLAISDQTLWQRLHRARLGLRRCLELNWFSTSKSDRE